MNRDCGPQYRATHAHACLERIESESHLPRNYGLERVAASRLLSNARRLVALLFIGWGLEVCMAKRNGGTRTRCMGSAGRVLLNREISRKNLSFSTVASVDMCWKKFVQFACEQGCRRLEHISRQLVLDYGRRLAVEVEQSDMRAGYAQRLVSAVNTVVSLSRTDWDPVKPVADCGITRRSSVRTVPPGGMDRETVLSVCCALREAGLHRVAVGVDLAWSFGLRSEEFGLLDTRRALSEATESGRFILSAGTKGGRDRVVNVNHDWQLNALREATQLQGEKKSLIPSDQTWQVFREGELYRGRAILKEHGIRSYHTLRAAFACRRYMEITGDQAPVFVGRVLNRDKDRLARSSISIELGHGRISVASSYVGGMK